MHMKEYVLFLGFLLKQMIKSIDLFLIGMFLLITGGLIALSTHDKETSLSLIIAGGICWAAYFSKAIIWEHIILDQWYKFRAERERVFNILKGK